MRVHLFLSCCLVGNAAASVLPTIDKPILNLTEIGIPIPPIPLPEFETKRTAYVRLINNFNLTLTNVTLYHKFSDDYKSVKVWDAIQPGEVTKETLTVNFDTGMTLGADWWKIVCVSGADGQASVYFSDPQNYRSVVEYLERAATGALAVPGAILGAILGLLDGGISGILFGARVGVGIAEAVNINLERTSDDLSNYWRFDLKTVDDGQIVSIALDPDMTMEFESKSDHGSTRLSSITYVALKKVASSVYEAYKQ